LQEEGTLLVHGSLSGAAELSNEGGIIGGNGTILRPFTVDLGDTLTPGQQINKPIGTLHTVAETWGRAGEMRLEIDAATGLPGTDWDIVEITGALTFTATLAQRFKLTLETLTPEGAPGAMELFSADQPYTWQIASATLGFVNFNAAAFTIDTSGFVNSFEGFFSVSVSDGNLYLNYLPVPEPSGIALAGLALIGFATRRIRAARNGRG
jgi:hypothetical protein